jgi:hypothetical protein
MEYRDAAKHIEALLRVLEEKQITAAECREKIEMIRLALVRRAANFPNSQRTVTYTFHRLERYVDEGSYELDDRAQIRLELHRMEMCHAFEAKP